MELAFARLVPTAENLSSVTLGFCGCEAPKQKHRSLLRTNCMVVSAQTEAQEHMSHKLHGCERSDRSTGAYVAQIAWL